MHLHRILRGGSVASQLHWKDGCPVPKRVDRDARRRAIAAALWRVAIRQGLEEVSLRHVAAEAGVSMGMVQHYFAGKDEMLFFALETLNDHVTQRVAANIHALPDPDDPRALIRLVLAEMLPLDEERRADAIVGFAFLAQAAVHPKIAGILRASVSQLEEFVSGQIRRAQEAGEVPGDLDVVRESVMLLALMDGLTAHILAGQRSPEEALAVLDAYLGRLFSPPSVRNCPST